MKHTERIRVNREHKDAVFRDIFGSEERKEYALQLFNALRGKDVADPSLLEINTLDDAVYLGLKNDVSFIVGGDMEVWEHQSTHNPNMPLRGLHYLSALYSRYVDELRLDPFGRRRLLLPTPHYVVFYNGTVSRPEREELLLSDLFTEGRGAGDLEVRVTVVNVNAGMNVELMARCPALAGYARFVELVRAYNRDWELRAAVSAAVDACIEEDRLAEYFRSRRSEVESMIVFGYTEEEARAVMREGILAEGREEGRELGIEEGRREATLDSACKAVRAGMTDIAGACEVFGVTRDELATVLGDAPENA